MRLLGNSTLVLLATKIETAVPPSPPRHTLRQRLLRSMSSVETLQNLEQTVVKPVSRLSGAKITKESRQEFFGQVAGGSGSAKPEAYQRAQIVAGTGLPCPKSPMRLNWRAGTLLSSVRPMTSDDGFDLTENFDGVQTTAAGNLVYVNLKCVVGKGGSQTRTLRDECYPMVEAQLRYILNHGHKEGSDNIWFANVFDGDEADRCMPKFRYLLAQPEFKKVFDRVFVGNLEEYIAWFGKMFG